jgi:hypothetical protein
LTCKIAQPESISGKFNAASAKLAAFIAGAIFFEIEKALPASAEKRSRGSDSPGFGRCGAALDWPAR